MNPFDLTKVWPHRDFPLIDVGVLELDRPPLPLHGAADRYDHRSGNDDFIQPGNLFRLLDAAHKQRVVDNIAAAMQGVPESIVRRQLALFAKCDPAYGDGVRRALKLDPVGDDRIKGASATDEARESEGIPA